jgi:hypothetical protein
MIAHWPQLSLVNSWLAGSRYLYSLMYWGTLSYSRKSIPILKLVFWSNILSSVLYIIRSISSPWSVKCIFEYFTYLLIYAYLLTDVPADHEDWPLRNDQMAVIDRNRPQLRKFLDADHDLFGKMRATTCLSSEQITYLSEILHENERNEELLDMMQRRSVFHLNEFIKCLKQTQQHLVPFFTGDEGNWTWEVS